MFEIIEQLNNIGVVTVLNVVVLVMIGVPKAIDECKKFLESLGLISKKEIHETEQERRIQKLEKNLEEYHQQSLDEKEKLTSSLDTITTTVNMIRSDFLDEKVERMRWRILDCANDIQNEKNVGIERVNYALKTYDDYEKIIEEHHLTNNQVEESIKYIKEYYQDLLHNR